MRVLVPRATDLLGENYRGELLAKRFGCFLRVITMAWMTLAIAGCGDKQSESAAKARKPQVPQKSDTELNVEPGYVLDGTEIPRVAFWGYEFEKAYETPTAQRITSGSSLQFLPVVRGAETGTGVRLEILSKGVPTVLGDYQAHYLRGEGSGQPSDYAKLIGCLTRVDLSAHTGEDVTFRWTLLGGGAKARATIALIKLIESTSVEVRPNILMICSDTHRADFATEGEGPDVMPRLNAFRADAVTYRRAYSNASWTLPSIASTMTGRFPRFHRTGERSESVRKSGDQSNVENRKGEFWLDWPPFIRYFKAFPSSGVTTFSDFLNARGYTTVWIAGNLFYSVSGMEKHGPELIFDARNMRGSQLNDMASRLMDEFAPDQPVFMLVHYLDVHQYRHWILADRFPGKWPMQIPREEYIEGYRESVRRSDVLIGELLDRWKAKYGFENSLVIFWSDHGEHLIDPGYMTPQEWRVLEETTGGDPIDRPPFFDHGNSMDEALLHVPLIVRYPDAYRLRGDIHETVSLVDLFPTILEVSGTDCGEYPYDGRSLIEIGSDGMRQPSPIFADYQLGGHEMSSVRVNDMKYVLRFDQDGGIVNRQLVDTSIESGAAGEPGQRVEDGATTARLERLFLDYATESDLVTKGMTSDVEMDVSRDLQSLRDAGYVAK